MSTARKREPLYVFFIVLMLLIGLAGVALFLYGSIHQGASMPSPGYRNIARLLLHG